MPFPSVTLLDSFIRAAESPLNNGGKWKALGGTLTNAFAGRITSEAYSALTAFEATKEDCAYWTPTEYHNPAVAVEIHALSSSGRWLTLWACLSTPTTNEKNGYRLRLVEEGTNTKATYVLERVDKSVVTKLAEVKTQVIAVGDRIGLTVSEGKVRAWHKSGAGEWTEITNAADATYTEGSVGIGADGNTWAARNFEAGGTTNHPHELTATQSSSAAAPKKEQTRALPTITQGQTVVAARGIARGLSVGQGQVASHSEVIGKGQPLSTTQGSSASLSHSISRTLGATQTSSASKADSITHALSASQGQAAVLTRAAARLLTVTQGQVASLAASLSTGQVLSTVQEAIAKLARSLARTLHVGQGQEATETHTEPEVSELPGMVLTGEFFPEGDEQYYWLALDPAGESGYRVEIHPLGGGGWQVRLLKWTEGVPSVVAEEVEVYGLPQEAWCHIRFSLVAHVLKFKVNGKLLIEGADSSFTTGYVAIGGFREANGNRNFTMNGTLLDSFEREEVPLGTANWTQLPFVGELLFIKDKGEVETERGWLPLSTSSGAYWNAATFSMGEEEGEEEEKEEKEREEKEREEKELTQRKIRSGVVARSDP